MNNLPPGHYFITGTDTDCGKTYVTLKLMHALKHQGYKVLGLKPIAAGGENTPAGLRNQDALLLQQCSDFSPDYALVNPYCFEIPASPHIAAQAAGVTLDAKTIARHYLVQDFSAYDYVFFEGAGGVHCPINMHETLCDLIKALHIPAILVVGMRLGCLNHALLSIQALESAGVPIAGWVANPIDPSMEYFDENQHLIESKLHKGTIKLS